MPEVVAFVSVKSPPRHYDEDNAPALTDFFHDVMDRAERMYRHRLIQTTEMFQEALDCSALTALSLAYTLHTTANIRPI